MAKDRLKIKLKFVQVKHAGADGRNSFLLQRLSEEFFQSFIFEGERNLLDQLKSCLTQ